MITTANDSARPRGTGIRNLIIVASILPLTALFILLTWAVARSGGQSGGFGVNNELGEVVLEQRLAPEFLAQSLKGDTVSLAQLQGQVVMVDFWSSWCPPCRQEAATLTQVYREYQGRDVEFIGVAIWDHPTAVRQHLQEFHVPYPNIMDDQQIAVDYGVAGLPEKFFIDRQGNQVHKFVGPMEPETLRAILEGLLGPQPGPWSKGPEISPLRGSTR